MARAAGQAQRRNSLSITADFAIHCRNYKSPQAERECKAYIASKSKSPMHHPNSTSQTSGGDKVENWELKMRQNMAEIQKKYREKYKELYKLDVQSKKHHETSLKRKHGEGM